MKMLAALSGNLEELVLDLGAYHLPCSHQSLQSGASIWERVAPNTDRLLHADFWRPFHVFMLSRYTTRANSC